MNKKEAQKIIESYFSGNEIDSEKTRKIKKLAMAHRIRLGEYRKKFCKKCYSDLRFGKVRLIKKNKIVTCIKCENVSRWKIKIK